MGILSKERLEEIDSSCGIEPRAVTHGLCRCLLIHIKLVEKGLASLLAADREVELDFMDAPHERTECRLEKLRSGLEELITGYHRVNEPEDMSANFCDGCSTRKKSVPNRDNIPGGASYCKECANTYIAEGGTLLNEFGTEQCDR